MSSPKERLAQRRAVGARTAPAAAGTPPKQKLVRPPKKAAEEPAAPVKKARRLVVDASSPETAAAVPVDFVWGQVVKETCGGMTSDEAERIVVGLRLPSLALQDLFGVTALPLGRFYRLAGDYGTNKSTFLDEMARWTILQGGLAGKVMTEEKDTAPFRNSLFDHDLALIQRYGVVPAETMEEMQEKFQLLVLGTEAKLRSAQAAERQKSKAKAKKPRQQVVALAEDDDDDEDDGDGKSKKKKAPAKVPVVWTCPFLFGIDSLTAPATEGTIEKVRKDGHASQDYARGAILISQFFSTLPHLISGKPFLLVATNHAKPGTNQQTGLPEVRVGGGKAPGFFETVEIQFTKVGVIKKAEYGGVKLKLKLLKNSLGPGDRSLMVDLLWTFEEVDREAGLIRQHTAWDWNAATIEMLLSKKLKSAKMYRAINEVVDLHPGEKRTIWSKALGVSSKAPVSYSRLGALLEQRRDLVQQLQAILCIQKVDAFQCGVPYDQQMADVAKRLPDRVHVLPIRDLTDWDFIRDEMDSVQPDGTTPTRQRAAPEPDSDDEDEAA